MIRCCMIIVGSNAGAMPHCGTQLIELRQQTPGTLCGSMHMQALAEHSPQAAAADHLRQESWPLRRLLPGFWYKLPFGPHSFDS